MLKTNLGRLRIVGFLEGISYLVLLGIAMPMKYYAGYEHATQDVGMAHGVLFILYIVLVLIVSRQFKWTWSNTLWALIASLLPFGTFIADHQIFKRYLTK